MTSKEKQKNKNYTNTPFNFAIKRGDKNSMNHEEANKIALIRGFGMVVEYYKPTASSISASLPYFGVVKVGSLLGSSDANEISETFWCYKVSCNYKDTLLPLYCYEYKILEK